MLKSYSSNKRKINQQISLEDFEMEPKLARLSQTVLTAMAVKAEELSHNGAMGVLFAQKDAVEGLRPGEVVSTGVLFEPMIGVTQMWRPSSEDPDVLYNLVNTVSGKIWQMVRTGDASGAEGAITGEPEYLGGLIAEWGEFYVFIAFSGAPQETDVIISTVGVEVLPDYETWAAEND